MFARRAAIAVAALSTTLVLAGCIGDELPAGRISDAHKAGKFWKVCVTDTAGQEQCHKFGVLTSARHCHTGDQWPACKAAKK